MRSVVRGRSAALLAAVLYTWCAAHPSRSLAAPWELTRQTVIEPINAEFHRHLPSFLRARDLDAVLALYAIEVGTGLTWDGSLRVYADAEEETTRWQGASGTESIRIRYERLLGLVGDIDRADLRIHFVDWRHPDADGYPTRVRLIVKGKRADGTLCQVDQHA